MKERLITGAIVVAIGVGGAVYMVSQGGGPKDERAANEDASSAPTGGALSASGDASKTRPEGAPGARAKEERRGLEDAEPTSEDGAAARGTDSEGSSGARGASAAQELEGLTKAADDAARAQRERAARGSGAKKRVSKADIKEAIRRIQPLMKSCYEQMLDDFPDAGGTIVAKLEVAAKEGMGEVETVSFPGEETQFDAEMTACMAKALSEVVFPVEANEDSKVVVSYPFRFANDDASK